MSAFNLEGVVKDIIAASNVTDPNTQLLIAQIATDSAQLATRSLAGETGLEAELAQVKAQALNLSIYTRRLIESQLAMRVTQVLVQALATI